MRLRCGIKLRLFHAVAGTAVLVVLTLLTLVFRGLPENDDAYGEWLPLSGTLLESNDDFEDREVWLAKLFWSEAAAPAAFGEFNAFNNHRYDPVVYIKT